MADKEYIEREALIKELCNSCDGYCDKVDCDCVNCKSEHRCDLVVAIAEAPAADVVEVRHGRWSVVYVDTGHLDMDMMYKCSLCRSRKYTNYNYCPNCGAKMDGKGEGK